ncbi:MAG: transposase [Acidimicrobiales bacterium]|nr:transposase [Acidimicrobiales bacterium]
MARATAATRSFDRISARTSRARWALLKNPGDLTDDQAATVRKLKRRGGDLWRAYALKEAVRAVFAGDLTEAEVGMLLDRFCSKASRSGLKPFVTAARTIRKRRDGILAAVRLGINNARHEGLNRRVRLIINRAHGFHSASAALGLIMLTLGSIDHVLPHERQRTADPQIDPHSCREAPETSFVGANATRAREARPTSPVSPANASWDELDDAGSPAAHQCGEP